MPKFFQDLSLDMLISVMLIKQRVPSIDCQNDFSSSVFFEFVTKLGAFRRTYNTLLEPAEAEKKPFFTNFLLPLKANLKT